MNATAKQQLSRNPSNAGYATPLKTYSVPATENPDGTINVPVQPVFGVDPNVEPIDSVLPVRIYPGGTLLRTAPGAVAIGAAAGLVIFTATKRTVFYSLTGDYVASATVGNRLVYARIADPFGTTVWSGALTAAIAANVQANYDISFGVANGNVSTAIRRNLGNTANTTVGLRENTSIPEIQTGWTIRIDDAADVDVADTFDYRFVYKEYP